MQINRREMIAAAVAFASATGMTVRDALAQKGFRLHGPVQTVSGGNPDPDPGAPDLTKAVILPEDLVYKGCYRFSMPQFGRIFSRDGYRGFTMKEDGRFFTRDIVDNHYNLLECAFPDEEPNPDVNNAPFITLYHNWGDVMSGHIRATMSNNLAGMHPIGLHYDDDKQTLWWDYEDAYTQSNCPSLSCTTLNYNNFTFTSRGPWRTGVKSARGRSALWKIPPAWASTYFDGYGVACGSSPTAGAGNSQGPSLTPLDLLNFDFETVPAMAMDCLCSDTVDWQINGKQVLWYDFDHALPTDCVYKLCGAVGKPGDPYSCDNGATLRMGQQTWGTQDAGSSSSDGISAGVWVDLPDKHGLVYFGVLVTTPPGYTAPNDDDGIVHRGYAALRNTVDGIPACCHGQPDGLFQATGPWGHVHEKYIWTLDPVKLIPLASGAAEQHSIRTMDGRFALRDKVGHLEYTGKPSGYGFSYGAGFDPTSRRVYVLFNGYDDVTPPWVGTSRRPVVMVFEVTA